MTSTCVLLQSLVANNAYKEMYVIFLMYEHVFSLLYEDGSSIDTKHRMLRVLETPLLCHSPFSIDRKSEDQVSHHQHVKPFEQKCPGSCRDHEQFSYLCQFELSIFG